MILLSWRLVMNSMIKIFIAICLLLTATLSFGMEKTFYILHSKAISPRNESSSLSVVKNHSESINVLISQAYHIGRNGDVEGYIDDDLLDYTKSHSIKLMAMVTNVNFDEDVSHQFLSNQRAQEKAIQSLVSLAKRHDLYGIQFDFEMIPLKDKNKLTYFYQLAAYQLHKNGFTVSFAVAPILSETSFSSYYQRKIYEVWQGAYDLNALGKVADFITLMAYNQHLGRMAPGPVASISWTEAAIKHTLQHVPAKKISLGIPTYSSFWYTGTRSSRPGSRITIQQDEISYKTAMRLLNKYHARLNWDASQKVNYALYSHNWLNEYLFVEDVKSFKAKLALAKKYHLRGISVFRIGTEDPRIWTLL